MASKSQQGKRTAPVRTYVLDTSVLLADPGAVRRFDEHEVVLRVRDTGAGMSEKELRTALEPFRQLATSARWGSSGTGLGLPIVKKVVLEHAGEISCGESELGGAVFCIELPLAQQK